MNDDSKNPNFKQVPVPETPAGCEKEKCEACPTKGECVRFNRTYVGKKVADLSPMEFAAYMEEAYSETGLAIVNVMHKFTKMVHDDDPCDCLAPILAALMIATRKLIENMAPEQMQIESAMKRAHEATGVPFPSMADAARMRQMMRRMEHGIPGIPPGANVQVVEVRSAEEAWRVFEQLKNAGVIPSEKDLPKDSKLKN